MCNEFSGSSDLSDVGSDLSLDADVDGDVPFTERSIEFAPEGSLDIPQDIPESFELTEDVYEAKPLDEVEILGENGDTHTVAERMEELYGENPMGEQLTLAQEGLKEFERRLESGEEFEPPAEIVELSELPQSEHDERLEELHAQRESLEKLKDAIMTGDKDVLELFGLLDDTDATEDEGFQKVLRR